MRDEPEWEFLHRLALEMGIVDVVGMAEHIPAAAVASWLAFYRRNPFGDDWRRTGRLAMVVAQLAGAKVENDFEELFIPGGGRYRGMNEAEIAMAQNLRRIPAIREQLDRR